MSVSSFLRYILVTLFLVSILALRVTSCTTLEESETATETTTTSETTTDDGGTTTTTSTTSTTDTMTGVIYQGITVKKKPKDPSIKYS